MAAQPPDERPSGPSEPDGTRAGAAGSPDESVAPDDLAARLEEVQRRTEELAARVAGFREEAERLAAEQTDRDDRGEAAENTDPGDSPGDSPDAKAEDGARPASARRHRPRPSPNAPLVYDDEPPAQGSSDAADGASASGATPPSGHLPEKKRAPEKKPEAAEKAKRSWTVPRWLRRVRTLVVVLVVLAALAFALRTWVAQPFTVTAATMEPTLRSGDHLLVQKVSYDFHDPQRGDLVVFDRPSGWRVSAGTLVGRVIGVPGDLVVIRSGRVRVNGALLDEPYLDKACRGTRPERHGSAFRIRKGRVFVMGDNRCHSTDSRAFGGVPASDVVGKVLLVAWPPSRFGTP